MLTILLYPRIKKRSLYVLSFLITFFANQLSFGQNFIKSIPEISYDDKASNFTSVGNIVFFTYNDREHGKELWKSDGTLEGTVMVKDINPGEYGSNPTNLFNFNGTLFFSAHLPSTGAELWKSDGTPEGTVLVKDLSTSTYYGSNPNSFIAFNNNLFFFSYDINQILLWKSDGTEVGTVTIKNLGSSNNSLNGLYAADGLLYFSYRNSYNLLFRSDGTHLGTFPIDTISFNIQSVNKKSLFYLAPTSTGVEGLWTISQRDVKPQLIKEFPKLVNSTSEAGIFTAVNNTLYFSRKINNGHVAGTNELWKSDGSTEGTQLLKNFDWKPYYSNSFIQSFVAFQNKLYFRGPEGNNLGYGLWKSDGTSEGTVKVLDGYMSGNSLPINDILYFVNSGDLWHTDGTTVGTKVFVKTNLAGQSNVSNLVNANGTLFFTASPGRDEYGRDMSLWNSKASPKIFVTDNWRTLAFNSTIDFSKVTLDSRINRTLTIQNVGNQKLVIGEIAVAGKNFSITGEVPKEINPGESKQVNLQYYPAVIGKHAGSVRIHSNDSYEGVFEISLTGQAEAPVAQQDFEALVALFKATNGANWYSSTNWNIQQNTVGNHWKGVTVENGRVTRLDLSYTNLNGYLPEELSKLTELTYLKLEENQLKGPIPTALGSLKKLETLWLFKNQLSGTIPKELGNCSALKVIALGQNQLTGAIPSEIGQLSNLTAFYVNNNRLAGDVPATLTGLNKLQTLYLNDNSFTSLPPFIKQPYYFYFYLLINNNRFTFKDLEPNLSFLQYSSNYSPQQKVGNSEYYLLNDTIASLLLTLPANLIDTQYHYQWTKNGKNIIGANQASYSITSEELSSEATYSCKITYDKISELILERADIFVQKPINDNEHNALLAFYKATNGDQWLNRTGWNLLKNNVNNQWYGIKTENGHIVEIDFGSTGNNLNGQIPTGWKDLPYLKKISINNNKDLKGSIPHELAELKNLSTLILNGNSLEGEIPVSIWQMSNLVSLNLSNNHLSGILPEKTDSLQKLTTLILNNSNLTGKIGNGLTTLRNLEYLSLAFNQIDGVLPSELGQLTKLRWLDLGNNLLSGPIPSSLGNLKTLYTLNLNNNQLSNSFPESLAEIVATKGLQVRVDHNFLTDLPQFPDPVSDYWWGRITVNNNRLSFEDIEPNLKYLGQYSPQDSVGTSQNYFLQSSQSLTLQIHDTLKSSNNRYQWFKNGKLIGGETKPSLITNSAGSYICRITNTAAINLTLYHRVIQVEGKDSTAVLLALDSNIISENQPIGTKVGNLSTNDTANDYIYSLVDGENDNKLFKIEGNVLQTNSILDFEKQRTFSVRVKANNSSQEFIQAVEIFLLNENDTENLPDLQCYQSTIQPVVPLIDVAYAPSDRLYAVGKAGTIRISSDNSNNWQDVKSGVATDLLAVHFPSSSIGYVVGNRGVVLKTADAGQTWKVLNTDTLATLYSVYFLDDQIGYIVGDKGLLMKTENGGENWLYISSTTSATLRSVYFLNKDIGYIAGAGQVFKTTNSGKNWQPLGYTSIADIYSIQFLDDQTGFASGLAGVSRTTDGGQSWQLTKFTDTDLIHKVRFHNAQTGYAVGGQWSPEFWKTTNGGTTWQKQTFDNYLYYFSGLAFNADGSKGCMVGYGNDRTYGNGLFGQLIYSTLNGGENWEQTGNLSNTRFTVVDFISSQVGYGFDPEMPNTILKTTDGGHAWKKIKSDSLIGRTSLTFLDENTGFAIADNKLIQTTDGALSWNTIFTMPAGQVWDSWNQFYFFDKNNGCIITGNYDSFDLLFKTTNGGKNWTQITLPFEKSRYQFVDMNVGYSIPASGESSNVFLKTTNGGISWDSLRVSSTHHVLRGLNDIAGIQFLNQNAGFAWDYNGQTYKTTDGGHTWSYLYGFYTYPNEFYFKNELEGYARFYYSIFKTTDGGVSWKQLYNSYGSERITGWSFTDSAIYYSAYYYQYPDYTSPLFKVVQNTSPNYAGVISGDRNPCLNSKTDYSIPVGYNQKFSWQLSGGGSIQAFGNRISILWHTPGTYTLTVYPENDCGLGTPSELKITVNDCPTTSFVGPDVVCAENTSIYSSIPIANVRYYWEVEGGVIQGSAVDTIVNIKWNRLEKGKVKLTGTNNLTGCRKDTTLIISVGNDSSKISLSDSTVAVNSPIESLVGVLIVQNTDSKKYNYTLVEGPGSTDNNLFKIEGDQLKTAVTFTQMPKTLFSIRVHAASGDACSFEFIQHVYLVDEKVYSISGSIIDENNNSVTASTVKLLEKRNDSFELISSQVLSGKNEFRFDSLASGIYTIKIEPDTTHFPNALPTYLGNVSTLAEAQQIDFIGGSPNYTMQLLTKEGVLGNITINGLLVESQTVNGGRIQAGTKVNAGTPLKEVPVYLKSAASNNIVNYAITDLTGKFTFQNLAAGKYYLLVDYKGIPMDNDSYLIELSEQENLVELTAIVEKDKIITLTQSVTGLDPSTQNTLSIWPNPISQSLSLRLNNIYTGEIMITVYDLLGRPIIINHYHKMTIDWQQGILLNDLSSGVYFIEVKFKNTSITHKIIKL